MNEEAGFIAALIAEPDDRTALLVYADWLDERDEPRRAGYFRLLATKRPSRRRLAQLGRILDPIWLRVVTDRCGCGSTVRITEGLFEGHLGELTNLHLSDTGEVVATVRITLWNRPIGIELPVLMTERVAAPAS